MSLNVRNGLKLLATILEKELSKISRVSKTMYMYTRIERGLIYFLQTDGRMDTNIKEYQRNIFSLGLYVKIMLHCIYCIIEITISKQIKSIVYNIGGFE